MADITASTIRRFIQDQVLNHQIKPRTIQRRISCLKSFSTYCVKENYIHLDFMAGIIAPKGDHKLPHYMKLAELQQFIRYLQKDRHPFALRNEALFKLLATTGMRRAEIIDLNWEQIDLVANTVLIHGKGKKERLLPLHPMVIPVLKEYQRNLPKDKRYPSEPVFWSRLKKELNPRSVHFLFKELLTKAGLPAHRFSLHHLRHTFATILLQQNDKVDLRTLQELLGHSSLATTSVYTHIDLEQKKKAIESFLVKDKE
ncbi:tyrosine-type recombinase/integrase [Virgibacillus subterraneus]|uniref:tyrosine-type recombinase/integrase n=1 Tax=Virgibacillus subterraneus TaxID=621109 RepID=UPI001FDFA6A1|nr:tyrosine-type recombinase/integrase [Virgibacillus subterraneus]